MSRIDKFSCWLGLISVILYLVYMTNPLSLKGKALLLVILISLIIFAFTGLVFSIKGMTQKKGLKAKHLMIVLALISFIILLKAVQDLNSSILLFKLGFQ